MNKLPGITACIITYNEELSLPECLTSLSFVDEIIVLDSYSNDRTLEVAEEFHAKIYKRKFDNFINQKNSCITHAAHEWILVIDADEIVSKDLSQEINDNILSDSDFTGYFLPRKTNYLNQWISHSGWYPNYSLRLFKNGKGRFGGINVHEKVILEGKAGKLKLPILHFSYKNISEHIQKINFYSTLIAKEKFEQKSYSSVLWAILKSISKFILTYFWRLGFLDGRVGLIIAVLAAYYNFQKYIKLWELNKNQQNRS
ncbi:MAG: glycosyltransferase family 2 protein [Spirochaetia bacterium]|nr:glycosyltransferase family 2 protein [Spirochaetia bacterium]